MFTGIIEATAQVLAKSPMGLVVEKPAFFTDIKEGSSIAVSGVCLTVTAFDERSISFDVVEETWQCTKLGLLKEGDRVNLERAMRADARFDGHVVQGHVEGVGKIENEKLKIEKSHRTLRTRVPSELVPFILPKGSITLDGVSLTVASIEGDHISVALIPTTLRDTTLGSLREGDFVNIETDIFVRAVVTKERTSEVS